jgi:threonine dehydratase
MAQGVAWAARELGIPATIVVPEHAPETKLAAIERLGGRVVKVSYDRWWQTIVESRFDGLDGLFVHPVQDDLVMAGNGTIGLEILEDLPDVDAVVIPWGGGGLTTGIASAVKALRPEVCVYAVEPETAAPLNATLAAGSPQEVVYQPSFVDGAGGRAVLPRMWEAARGLIDGAREVSLNEAALAIRLLVERTRVVAEGAGALAVAAALSGEVPGRRLACVVSGGNIDSSTLASILAGTTP